jgi:acetylglutamate kinase
LKLLVKLGGTLLDAEDTREALVREIAAISHSVSLIVVHGGGRQMTRFLSERGIESQFVNGLRVTTPAILDAVVKVVAGSVNSELVAALNRVGARAVGLSGIDAGMLEAEQMDPALGSVGRVIAADPALFQVLLRGGFLPVVACLAGDREGRLYNVNADQMAVACATAFGASQLIFLTDVEGVLDAGKHLVPHLTLAGSQSLIVAGAATGGMLAKLNAAQAALRQGVSQVRIAGGASSGILERILAGEDAGTRIAGAQPCPTISTRPPSAG